MPRLKCGVDTCAYWHGEYCIREGIHVKGESAFAVAETRCSSYRQRGRTAGNTFHLEIGKLGDPQYLEVSCEAVNCLFNKREVCRAEEIKIDGSRARKSAETFCSSFVLK
ncbi:MAG TPA: DUF1540 domain-containing protein [Acholeplasmataceae bacterium]|jgi:hypothetical protein|nr:DUF1540 domain-containing protein [Acholeplasmataceae bacterium]